MVRMAIKYLAGNRVQGSNAERLGDTGLLATQTSGSHDAWFQKNGIGWRDVNGWKIISSSEDANGDSLVGQTLTSFTMQLKKASSATGDLAGGIWYSGSNVTATPDVTFSNTVSSNIANLTESYVYYTFTGSRVLAVGDVIAVSQTSGGTNQMSCVSEYYNSGGYFPSTLDLKAELQFTSGWVTDSNFEPNGSLYKASDLTDWSDLDAGTIFEEYDTGDHFIWSGSAWNEMS